MYYVILWTFQRMNFPDNSRTVVTRVMQTFYNELSISVSDSVKYKQKEVNTYTLNFLVCVGATVELCYQAGVKLVGFWFQLEASGTDDLWYNETVCR